MALALAGSAFIAIKNISIYFFRLSRISLSNNTSSAGAAGATGAGSTAAFFFMRLICFTIPARMAQPVSGHSGQLQCRAYPVVMFFIEDFHE